MHPPFFPLSLLSPTHCPTAHLNNSLQLPRIPQGILNHHLAHLLLLLLLATLLLLSRREIDMAVLDRPAARARKLDDGALRVEEQEGLGRGEREGGIGALGRGGDFGADL